MPKRVRNPGEFCWINVLTPQTAKARDFFAALLGWTYTDIGMGHIIRVDGSDIGGFWDSQAPNMPASPPSIGPMVKVRSVDETKAKATAIGGTIVHQMDIAENGRMAVIADPTGAIIDVWEPKQQPGTDVDAGVHGAQSWHELMTNDTGKAAAFYTQLFGWAAEKQQIPGIDYTVFTLGTEQAGGMMKILPEMGPMPPHWGVYFTVTDVDATAKQATTLGASLYVPPTDIPNIGRFAGIKSPQGVRFYAMTYLPRS